MQGIQRFGVLTFSYQSATETIDIDYLRVKTADGTIIPTPAGRKLAQDNLACPLFLRFLVFLRRLVFQLRTGPRDDAPTTPRRLSA
jgi:hypothetical protein